MHAITETIDIAAEPDRVWAVLTDFAHYPDWNPFIVSMSGQLVLGAKLRARLAPPGGKPMTFTPTLTVLEPGRAVGWLGRLLMPGIFDGAHRFELQPIEGGTRFTQTEEFRGVLVPLTRRTLAKTAHGFQALNKAMKARAEAG